MKIFIAVILSLFVSFSAYADASSCMGLGISAPAAECIDATYSSALTQSQLPATDNAIDLGSAAKTYRNVYSHQSIRPAAAVMTPSTAVPTPAAGNTLSEVNTIIAAGAPTAAFVVLPVATASVGKTYRVFNQGSNPVAIVPQTGVVNVSAALTPFACTTLKECECTGLTTGVFGCSQK